MTTNNLAKGTERAMLLLTRSFHLTDQAVVVGLAVSYCKEWGVILELAEICGNKYICIYTH